MQTLVFVFAFCIVAVLVYMGRYSGRLRVSRARTVAAPLASVYDKVADMHQWQAWNPWLEHEPGLEATLSEPCAGPGATIGWESPRLGAGRIVHLRLVANRSIDQRMEFRQPFKFHGRARWEFAERDGRTEVTWSMRGRVGFSMRAFAETVQGMIALDFRYGLDRLATASEPLGRPAYTISYPGLRDIAAARYACLTYRGPLDGLALAVPETISRLRQQLAAAGIEVTSDPVAIYVRTQVKRRTTECRIGLCIGSAVVPAGDLQAHEIPALRAFVVRLEGNPQAMEIAWYHAMQRMRIEGIEPELRIPPFERYLADAAAAQGSAVGVELHIAVRPPAAAAPADASTAAAA